MGILTIYMQFIERGKFYIGKLGKINNRIYFISIIELILVDKTGLDPVSWCTISSKLKK